MRIGLIIERILIVFTVLDVTMAFSILRGSNRKSKDNIWFVVYALASAVWSYFFGELIIQDTPDAAWWYRWFGMIGTFWAIISITFIFASWSKLPSKLLIGFRIFSLSALVFFQLTVREGAAVFGMTDFGMSYKLTSYYGNYIYNAYTLCMGVIFLILLWSMYKGKNSLKRDQVLARQGFIILALIGLGMLVDTIMPVLGVPAIPGSTLMQFLGVNYTYRMINYANRTKLSLSTAADRIFHMGNSMIMTYDQHGDLVYATETAALTFDLYARPLKSRKLTDIFDVEFTPITDDQTVLSIEAAQRGSKRHCSIEVQIVRDEFNDLIGFIAIVTDTSEKFQYVIDLQAAKDRADQANAAKSTFLANMSHEIRTPINTVLGMNEMIRRETTSEDIKKYSEDIRVAGEGLLSIINDILDFSKIEAGKVELIEGQYDLGTMLEALNTMFSLKSESKGLDFIAEIDPNLPSGLFGDELRIRQILMNLLNNAIKYTEHGHVTFRVKGIPQQFDVHRFIFEVEDTGIGIKPEDKDKLFATFTRLNGEQTHYIEGTGLGLSIVKGFSDILGGKVEVESEYGSGSLFRFTVEQRVVDSAPLSDLKLHAKDVRDARGDYRASFIAPEAHVLIVDDNRMNLAVITGLLKRTGIQIDTADSAAQCIELVKKKSFNIIFMDHMMPVMDGVEALGVLKAMSPEENKSHDAVIFALTANALSGSRELYLGYGFDGYLSKPVEYLKLEEAIRDNLPASLIKEAESEAAGEADGAEAGSATSREAVNQEIRDFTEMGIDLEEALNYCGTMEVVESTARAFCEMADEMCEKLSRCRAERDIQNYRIHIHGVKANARTLGVKDMFEFALSQENSCKEGNFKPIIEADDKPECMMGSLAAKLRAFYNIEASQAEVPEDGQLRPLIKQEEIEDICNKTLEYLDNFEDGPAYDELNRFRAYDLTADQQTCLTRALGKIKQFDYEGAAEDVESLRQA